MLSVLRLLRKASAFGVYTVRFISVIGNPQITRRYSNDFGNQYGNRSLNAASACLEDIRHQYVANDLKVELAEVNKTVHTYENIVHLYQQANNLKEVPILFIFVYI